MTRGILEVSDQKRIPNGDKITFSLRGNGIKFEQVAHKHKLDIGSINENFRNNLRYVKHMGGYPDKEHEDPTAMMHELKSMWSQSAIGISLRPANDPLPEFTPFL